MTMGSGYLRDTVASVGLFSTRTLPFVGANNTIRVFRQALSLDEVREVRERERFQTSAALPIILMPPLKVILTRDVLSDSAAQGSARTCIIVQFPLPARTRRRVNRC